MFAIANSTQRLMLSQKSAGSESTQSSQEASDTALIRAIAAGDKRAMHMLYLRHNVRVFRFILRMIDNRSLAEDLVSEVPRRPPSWGFQSEVASFHLVIGHCPLQGALGDQASFR